MKLAYLGTFNHTGSFLTWVLTHCLGITMTRINDFGQPIGPAVDGWTERPKPTKTAIDGQYCRLEPLDPGRHAADLFAAYQTALDGRAWTYLFAEPFTQQSDFSTYVARCAQSVDPMHFAVVDAVTKRAVGTMALMRIDPAHGVMEVGALHFHHFCSARAPQQRPNTC